MSDRDLTITVQRSGTTGRAPSTEFIERCARQALGAARGDLVIRIVDESESARLNTHFLGKQGATNVLAFPAGEVPGLGAEPVPLGDIAICAAIVAREAGEQGKPVEAHWAHMVVHGCLHVLGHGHDTNSEAAAMESEERRLLASLGFDDPYAADA